MFFSVSHLLPSLSPRIIKPGTEVCVCYEMRSGRYMSVCAKECLPQQIGGNNSGEWHIYSPRRYMYSLVEYGTLLTTNRVRKSWRAIEKKKQIVF